MAEDVSFVAPGHLPSRWSCPGPPPPPQGYHPPPQGHQWTPHGYKQHPHKYQQHPQAYQPQQEATWMTPEIRKELQSRNQLRKASQLSDNPADRQAYHTQCQRVQALIDSAKASLGSGGSVSNVGSPGVAGSQQYQQGVVCQGYQQAAMGGQRYQQAVSERQQQGELEERFSCGPCNRTFYSRRRLDDHLREHVECPFPECRLSAHPKVVERHIDNQHLLVNFANLQIDDEQWVAERKRRFPTSQRAELRRATQLERAKRGERLGRTTKPFPDKLGKKPRGGGRGRGVKEVRKTRDHKEQNGLVEQNGQKQDDSTSVVREPGRGAGRRGRRRGHPQGRTSRHWESGGGLAGPTRPLPPTPDDLLDSDEEARDGIPAFRGTRHLYETTGEVSYFGNAKEGENSDVAEKDEINISDEEEWVAKDVDAPRTPTNTSITSLSLGGALGCLMGAYSDSEEDSDAPDATQKAPPPPENSKCNGMTSRGEKPSTEQDRSTSLEDNSTDGKTNSSSREEHTSANRKTDAEDSSATHEEIKGDRKTDSGNGEDDAPQNTGPHRHRRRQHRGAKRRRITSNPRAASHPFRCIPKRRKTLLHRLLLPDITRERNLILQCVRYIVKNNFFMNGEEREMDTTKKGTGQQEEVERNNGEGARGEREDCEGMEEEEEEREEDGVAEGESGKENEGGQEKTTPDEQLNNGTSGCSTQRNTEEEEEEESQHTKGTPEKHLSTEARATTTTPVTAAKTTPGTRRTSTDTPDEHGTNMTDTIETRATSAHGMNGIGANEVITEDGCPSPPFSGNRAVTTAKKRSLQALLEEGSDRDTTEEESASKRQNPGRQGNGEPP